MFGVRGSLMRNPDFDPHQVAAAGIIFAAGVPSPAGFPPDHPALTMPPWFGGCEPSGQMSERCLAGNQLNAQVVGMHMYTQVQVAWRRALAQRLGPLLFGD